VFLDGGTYPRLLRDSERGGMALLFSARFHPSVSVVDQSNQSKHRHQHSETDQDHSKSQGRWIERFSSRHCPAESGRSESKDYEEYASTQQHPILSHVLVISEPLRSQSYPIRLISSHDHAMNSRFCEAELSGNNVNPDRESQKNVAVSFVVSRRKRT